MQNDNHNAKTHGRHFWWLFYAIAAIGTAIMLYAGWAQYRAAIDRADTEMRYLTRSVAETTVHYFMQYETLLDMAGFELLIHPKKANMQRLFDKIVADNSAIAGVAAIRPDGTVFISSSNNDPVKIPNILQQPQSRETFKKALLSKEMVPGKVYYLDAIGEWILPLRKAVRDADGNVVAVISIGIKSDSTAAIFGRRLPDGMSAHLILDHDWYPIYQSAPDFDHYHGNYGHKIEESTLDAVEEDLYRSLETNFDALRQSEAIALMFFPDCSGGEDLVSWRYIARYHLWVHLHMRGSKIFKPLYRTWLNDLALFLMLLGIVYYLIRQIAKIQRQYTDRLYRLAMFDPLTQLPNRFYLQEVAERRIGPGHPPFGILSVDLDNFKSVNDRFGHDTGDLVLKEIAARMRDALPRHTILVRHSGDEFIALADTPLFGPLARIAADLIDAVAQPVEIEGAQIVIGASVGICRYPKDGETLFELLSAADIAMHKAKERKRHFQFYLPKLKDRQIRQAQVEQELRFAIERDELSMRYQPQVDAMGRLHGVEALVRWESPILGPVSPGEFIPIAERSGLIVSLGEWILERAVEEIARLQADRHIAFTLSVNTSIRQYAGRNLYRVLMQTLQKYDFDPNLFVVEITESLFIDNTELVVEQLESMKRKGIGVSLDDFGTGYSSLSFLRKLPIDELKIDKSFIDSVPKDPQMGKMVREIFKIAQIFGFETVAEGVEEAHQVEWLASVGCDYFQGYFFSKPLEAAELGHFIDLRGVINPPGRPLLPR
jgi:diguanylate cyclase (GGDEF)-like protein